MNDLQIQNLIFGILLTIIIVKILKHIFKFNRPNLSKGYGFPSTRSSVIFFITTFMILCNKLNNKTIKNMLIIAFIICFLKYVLNEHSFIQLLVGSIIGFIMAKIMYYYN